MKKTIFGGVAILAVAAVVAFSVNFNTFNLSSLALENIEALAKKENGDLEPVCDYPYCWSTGDCWDYDIMWDECFYTGFPGHHCMC